MKKFIESNGRVDVINMQDGFLQDEFSAGVYSIKQSMTGLYLNKEMDRFEMPDEIYGITPRRAHKIFSTFESRDNTTGVLLTGLKGAGKTFLIKYVSNLAIENDVPVILVNDPYTGDDFIAFVNSLGKCVIVFDEFAKTYKRNGDEKGQEALLTLFDGVASGKKLILLSENNRWDISELYKDRPSRVYYSYEYEKLDPELIEEYSKAHLVNQKFVEDILSISKKTLEFSFDILQSIIEECNRFPDEEFAELVADLNISITAKEKHLLIKSVVGIEGSVYDSMAFKPIRNIVNFDDFYANINAIEINDDASKNDKQRVYADLDYDSFVSVVGNDYVFESNNVKIIAEMIVSKMDNRPKASLYSPETVRQRRDRHAAKTRQAAPKLSADDTVF